MSARMDKAVGRYVYVTVDGVEYRVFFEESGSGIPLLTQHTASTGTCWRMRRSPGTFGLSRTICPTTAGRCPLPPCGGGSRSTTSPRTSL